MHVGATYFAIESVVHEVRKIFLISVIFLIWSVAMMVDASHIDDFSNKYGVSTNDIAGCWEMNFSGEYVNKCAERDAAGKVAWVMPLVVSLFFAGLGYYLFRLKKHEEA